MLRSVAAPAVVTIAFALCTGCQKGVRTYNDGQGFPKKLSAWHLFRGKPSRLNPNTGVIPYDLITPLFSDYATKRRFVWMPPGTSAQYREDDGFEFPVGTILVKAFSYPDHGRETLIETRLLVRTRNGWFGLPYVWNADETEAELEMAADPVRVTYRHPSGRILTFDYQIPNANQCKGCHEKAKTTVPIGPKARNLNRDFAYASGSKNQLAYWTEAGYLRGAPDAAHAPRVVAWNDPSAPLEERARAYLDVNCAHCHNAQGPANNSGLYLSYTETDPMRLGFHKVPVSAGNASGGLLFDLVAGHPEESILIHRMESTAPKILMPELGRSLVHQEGVQLIRDWLRNRS